MGSRGKFFSSFSVSLIFFPKPNSGKCHYPPYFLLPIFHSHCFHPDQTYRIFRQLLSVKYRKKTIWSFSESGPYLAKKKKKKSTTLSLSVSLSVPFATGQHNPLTHTISIYFYKQNLLTNHQQSSSILSCPQTHSHVSHLT